MYIFSKEAGVSVGVKSATCQREVGMNVKCP